MWSAYRRFLLLFRPILRKLFLIDEEFTKLYVISKINYIYRRLCLITTRDSVDVNTAKRPQAGQPRATDFYLLRGVLTVSTAQRAPYSMDNVWYFPGARANLTNPLHLVQRLRINTAIPPPPHTPSRLVRRHLQYCYTKNCWFLYFNKILEIL
jgi:hypothetical protein